MHLFIALNTQGLFPSKTALSEPFHPCAVWLLVCDGLSDVTPEVTSVACEGRPAPLTAAIVAVLSDPALLPSTSCTATAGTESAVTAYLRPHHHNYSHQLSENRLTWCWNSPAFLRHQCLMISSPFYSPVIAHQPDSRRPLLPSLY